MAHSRLWILKKTIWPLFCLLPVQPDLPRVCYTHGMFAAQVEMIREQYAIMPGEIDLPMLPVFALFNPALGMCTVVPEMNPSRPAKVDPAKIVLAIQQNQITNSFVCLRFGRRLLATVIAEGSYCLAFNAY